MNNIEFFLNNNKTIDPLAEEITIVGNKIEEHFIKGHKDSSLLYKFFVPTK